MEAPGDKMATTHAEEPSNKVLYPPASKRGKSGKPVAMVKFGSASVPVYRCDSGGRVRWLRGFKLSAGSRNSMLACVKVLFSHARSQNCLPAEQMTAPEQLKKVKLTHDDVAVFSPEEMATILYAAPMHLIPIRAPCSESGGVEHYTKTAPLGNRCCPPDKPWAEDGAV